MRLRLVLFSTESFSTAHRVEKDGSMAIHCKGLGPVANYYLTNGCLWVALGSRTKLFSKSVCLLANKGEGLSF